MPDPTHTTPDGEPLIETLAEETFGGLSIDIRWFAVPEGETIVLDGDSAVTNLLMYSEDGTRTRRVTARLSIESVGDWEERPLNG